MGAGLLRTLGGEDVTANFAFEYDISVTLTDSQFNITSTGTVNTPYTGKAIALGTGIVVQMRQRICA